MPFSDHASPRLRFLVYAAGLLVSASAPVLGDNGSWATGSGNWVDAGNWAGSIIPGANGTTTNTDIATFGVGGLGGTITVDSGRNVGGITFGTNNYVLTGGPLVLSGGATAITGTTGSLAVQSNLRLEASSTFTGSGTGGGLSISGNIAGAAISSTNYVLTLAGTSETNAVSGVISDGLAGGTVSLVKSGTGLWTLSNANTYTGGTTIGSVGFNRLLVTHGNALGTGSVTVSVGAGGPTSYGQLQLSGGIDLTLGAGSQIIVTSGTSTNGASLLNVAGDNSYTGIVQAQGNLEIGSSAGKLTLGAVVMTYSSGTGGVGGSGNRSFEITGDGDGEIGGRIYHSTTNSTRLFNIAKSGNGTWILSNSGTGTDRNFYRNTTVSGGTLLVNTDNTLVVGTITVNAGGSFGGDGISGGVATFGQGSFLTPGEGDGLAGVKTFTKEVDISAMTLATGGLVFDLGTTSDQVLLTGVGLALNIGTLELNDFGFTFGAGFGAGSRTLFDTQTAVVGALGANVTGIYGDYELTLSLENANQDVVLTAVQVPEPSHLTFISLAGLGLIISRRRRK